jgi:hypothetical protein
MTFFLRSSLVLISPAFHGPEGFSDGGNVPVQTGKTCQFDSL